MPQFETYWSGLSDGTLSDAGKVGITDTSGAYTSTNVDGALDEIAAGTADLPYSTQLIERVTLSGASTVLIDSIPGTFTDLEVVLHVPATSANLFCMRINGDTGSNYTGSRLRTSSTSVSGTNYTAQAYAQVGATPASGAPPAMCRLLIPDYANTSFEKVLMANYGLYNGTNWEQGQFTWVWGDTSAITSLLFGVGTGFGNLPIGTVASAYGHS